MGNKSLSLKRWAVESPLPIATVVDAPASAAPSTGVTLTVTPEMTVYSNSTCEATLGVNLKACPAPSDLDRAPVDCVVVTDVSGSMAGQKLALVQQTIKLLLDEFGSKDRVGLVTFDTKVQERLKLSAMDATSNILAASEFDSFRAGSSTNLSGGLFAGLQQLIDAQKADQRMSKGAKQGIKTVLLMTDGQANHGLKTAEEIVPVLTNMLDGTGISLHTFGYGSGHDSTLLRNLASTGHGSYYFVENADDIRSAFGDCLGGLLSVVAQNLMLELEPIHPKALIKKVHHKSAIPSPEPGTYRVPFADLYGDESRDVLVSLALPEEAFGGIVGNNGDASLVVMPVLRATLKYIDVLGSSAATAHADGAVKRAAPRSAALAAAVVDPEVEQQRLRLLVIGTLDEARATASKGNLTGARTAIAQSRDAVAETLARRVECGKAPEENEMLVSYLEDLDECILGLRDTVAFRSTNHKMAMLSEGHLQQRCMDSRVETKNICGELTMHSNVYRTASKKTKTATFVGLF